MIAFLRGRVLDKQPNLIIVDVQGVGYEVRVPLSTYYDVGDTGTDVALHIHTHVREEALHLYGFLTTIEQQLFERLIAISGIGPKLAVAVLSGIEPSDLVGAVQRSDIARLTGIPGVGRKTAERMILELKDRLANLAVSAGTRGPALEASGERLRDDVLSALQNLGYHRPLAEKAVDSTLSSTGAPSFEQALRAALRELMR
ncbi:MAG: Holliday junction branch migration protein RuvA [Acidobacteria bacterium]|nr:Holliday junction branch migration protein RuvA [Acidobacteriota bacterium]